MSLEPKKLAILVAGGPAPGINSVISAATIRSILSGTPVVGILDGFKYIMKGDITHIIKMNIEDVSRIHFRGGSFLGIARDNPTKDPKHLENTITSLLRLNVTKLITIGGDDTAYSAYRLEQMAAGRITVVHVPKTIDNDLDLPHGIPTFGFQTARHVGVEIVKNIMTDAQTTSRWYFVISMGRKAGHLALAIGKATGATLTLIPEEFPTEKISLKQVVDILVGSIIKRLSYGKQDGVAVLAEGLVEHMDPKELSELVHVEKDDHDNIRLAEVNFGEILKIHVQKRLVEYGIKVTVVAKNIGYELRCADPIPFDMEYCRDLGYMASKFLQEGGSGALVSMQNGDFVPMYFKDILDKNTGRMKIRMVNKKSPSYEVARQYMIRLVKDDFNDPNELAKYAATANMSLDDFRERYEYLVNENS
ncbi:MAG TPA: 6-phosphofructokinase [Bacteroidales bacterium]|nr:MAG: 6-phosphofructokinase [Bacteroidetes bacterium GWF2_33_38]OFY74271.1 MAG: 6-phosphofructokinase [Bacteroidetes bacterium RIFOXYA12_FULL_33_9]OFY86229.1 MAG: 6-phosphofructokinase [Bacteroidetes bacterium RIFOXYA2_FULL_33_7]HBF89233.1 6-phosphofructokinase [Bacteroidales bacterium]